ncbi:MAG TPA: hypothetical protein VGN72_02135 [Tepidisphaeraceae bacterium]|nr:hypothetical protein [Tepidisphaeraceae bacterium]
MSNEQLQVDEVVAALRQRGGCTLVHIDSGHEVDLYNGSGEDARPWVVRYSMQEIPDKPLLTQALSLGLELRDPCPGSGVRRYELYRHVMGITAVAIKALALTRMLPGVPANAWLWVTDGEYDQRGEPPEPPSPWPPAGT